MRVIGIIVFVSAGDLVQKARDCAIDVICIAFLTHEMCKGRKARHVGFISGELL